MKNLKLIVGFIFFMTFSASGFSQGFTTPAEGKAAVYFVRVTSVGGLSSFEFFRDREFIGIFKKKNYMRFEFPAGKQLLWASSENKEFLDCDLKAGEIYIILVNVAMGAWKVRVGLEPVTADNPDFQRVKDVVQSQPPVVTPASTIQSTTAKLQEREFVQNIMFRYETEWKNSAITQKVTPEMFVPMELLK